MADKLDVEAFKNELKNLWYYQKRIKYYEGEIMLLEYEMANVKGVNYSKQSGNSYNPSAIEERRLNMIDQLEKLNKKKDYYKIRVDQICEILQRMNEYDRSLVMSTVADKRKYKDVAFEHKMNPSTLFAMVNTIIKNAI